jgi:hypothetical protein
MSATFHHKCGIQGPYPELQIIRISRRDAVKALDVSRCESSGGCIKGENGVRSHQIDYACTVKHEHGIIFDLYSLSPELCGSRNV